MVRAGIKEAHPAGIWSDLSVDGPIIGTLIVVLDKAVSAATFFPAITGAWERSLLARFRKISPIERRLGSRIPMRWLASAKKRNERMLMCVEVKHLAGKLLLM
jgi:hypothetical protein